jgi:DNA ligase-associated metallophosphoesterase
VTAAPLHFAGERLLLDPLGALVWPAAHVLAIADLHLEKGSFFARRGQLMPPWDTQATLEKLALLLRRYRPQMVVAVGDSFHDETGAARLMPHDAARLSAFTEAARFIWVRGNHDPEPHPGVRGESTAEWRRGPLVFRHQAIATREAEISGHFHPKASVPVRGCMVTRPCFVVDGRRILLPAFGAYTGGLDIRDPAIAGLFPRGGRAFLLGQNRLFSFALSQARYFVDA